MQGERGGEPTAEHDQVGDIRAVEQLLLDGVQIEVLQPHTTEGPAARQQRAQLLEAVDLHDGTLPEPLDGHDRSAQVGAFRAQRTG